MKFSFLISLLTLSACSFAEQNIPISVINSQWEYYDGLGLDDMTFIDKSRIISDKPGTGTYILRTVTRLSYPLPGGKFFTTTMERFRMNCAANTLYIEAYSLYDRQGALVKSDNIPSNHVTLTHRGEKNVICYGEAFPKLNVNLEVSEDDIQGYIQGKKQL